jgi:hypothetical protein
MIRFPRSVLGVVTAGALTLGTVGGVAYAVWPSASAATPTASLTSLPTAVLSASGLSTGTGARLGLRARLLGRLVDGRLVIRGRDGRLVTVVLQRGTVTAVDLTTHTVTVHSIDGHTATYLIGVNSRIREDRTRTTLSAVHVGDRVLVAAVAGSPPRVLLLRDRGPGTAGA